MRCIEHKGAIERSEEVEVERRRERERHWSSTMLSIHSSSFPLCFFFFSFLINSLLPSFLPSFLTPGNPVLFLFFPTFFLLYRYAALSCLGTLCFSGHLWSMLRPLLCHSERSVCVCVCVCVCGGEGRGGGGWIHLGCSIRISSAFSFCSSHTSTPPPPPVPSFLLPLLPPFLPPSLLYPSSTSLPFSPSLFVSLSLALLPLSLSPLSSCLHPPPPSSLRNHHHHHRTRTTLPRSSSLPSPLLSRQHLSVLCVCVCVCVCVSVCVAPRLYFYWITSSDSACL